MPPPPLSQQKKNMRKKYSVNVHFFVMHRLGCLCHIPFLVLLRRLLIEIFSSPARAQVVKLIRKTVAAHTYEVWLNGDSSVDVRYGLEGSGN
jgi:hypothetical protein